MPGWPLRDHVLWTLGGLALLLLAGPALQPQVPAWAWALAAAVCATGAAVAGVSLRRTYPHDRLGACNVVTLARWVIAAGLVAPLVAGSPSGWGVVAAASAALALDGVDGWLARRERRVSDFGARYDMEVDSALALILSLHALGTAGPLVLVLGLARYAFVLAALGLPWLQGPLPERFSRKTVCVLQIGTLILLQIPGVAPPVAAALVAAAAGALAWSFGRDILHLRRVRT